MIFQVGKTSRCPACIKIKKRKKTPLKREENLRGCRYRGRQKGKVDAAFGHYIFYIIKMYMSVCY